jgi:hypothetical protein
LRPEFLLNYEKPLNPDVLLLNQVQSEQFNEDYEEVLEASNHLHTKILEKFLAKLHSLKVLPVDSRSLRRIFFSNGISLKYMGKIAASTKLPHIKEICEMEMIAISCSKILRCQIRQAMD